MNSENLDTEPSLQMLSYPVSFQGWGGGGGGGRVHSAQKGTTQFVDHKLTRIHA